MQHSKLHSKTAAATAAATATATATATAAAAAVDDARAASFLPVPKALTKDSLTVQTLQQQQAAAAADTPYCIRLLLLWHRAHADWRPLSRLYEEGAPSSFEGPPCLSVPKADLPHEATELLLGIGRSQDIGPISHGAVAPHLPHELSGLSAAANRKSHPNLKVLLLLLLLMLLMLMLLLLLMMMLLLLLLLLCLTFPAEHSACSRRPRDVAKPQRPRGPHRAAGTSSSSTSSSLGGNSSCNNSNSSNNNSNSSSSSSSERVPTETLK
ncbi:hypothetical protein Emed_002888 [Eimeria media]